MIRISSFLLYSRHFLLTYCLSIISFIVFTAHSTHPFFWLIFTSFSPHLPPCYPYIYPLNTPGAPHFSPYCQMHWPSPSTDPGPSIPQICERWVGFDFRSTYADSLGFFQTRLRWLRYTIIINSVKHLLFIFFASIFSFLFFYIYVYNCLYIYLYIFFVCLYL